MKLLAHSGLMRVFSLTWVAGKARTTSQIEFDNLTYGDGKKSCDWAQLEQMMVIRTLTSSFRGGILTEIKQTRYPANSAHSLPS
jgi:hypothetical protein